MRAWLRTTGFTFKRDRHIVAGCVGAVFLATTGAVAMAAAPFVDPLDLPAPPAARAPSELLTGIAANTSGRILAVGRYGRILHSDDHGATWVQASVPTSADLVAVTFADETHAWAVGHGATVLRSNDAGATWQRSLDGAQVTRVMLKAYEPLAAAGDEIAIRALDDTRRLIEEGPSRPFLDVWFDTPDAGFAVGAYNLIFRTADGGMTWQLWSDHVDNPGGYHLNAIRRIGGVLYIAGELGGVWQLDEAQQRFVRVSTPYAGTWFGITGTRDLLVLHGLRGNAWVSADQGATWRAAPTQGDTGLAGGTTFEGDRVVLASVGGQLLACSNPCERFERLPIDTGMSVHALVALPARADAPASVAWVGSRGVTVQTLP